VKENFPYLFWAYNLIWIFIAAYLGILMAKQRSLRRQIDEIKARLGNRGEE
jgi:CcmD family protein